MESTKTRSEATQRTRSVVFVGLTIAIMAVSAWVVVPLGPIPFTLQMFAITFAIVVLSPKEAIAAITGFANAVASPAIDFRAEGVVTGTAVKMFTVAGPVIVFGTAASAVYGLILWAVR